MEPELTNDRAHREWAWLCARVGEERARAAIEQIPGGRKAYPLNIARALGVTLPEPDMLPALAKDRARGLEELAKLRRMLGGS